MRSRKLVPSALAIAALSLMVGSSFVVGPASAHGALANPPSRTYLCRFLQPDAGACARAWAANPQALYDWMEVNIGDAAGQHQALIPDGQLCSAGRAKYAAFDEPAADWPATPISPNADGRYQLTYEATAPHATAYFRLYITRADYQPTDPLGWGDLELAHDSGALPAQPSYQFDVALPARTGHHVLYQVWQRSDSPEAFYACSDVLLGGQGGQAPSTTGPPTSAAPSSTTAPAADTDADADATPPAHGSSPPPTSTADGGSVDGADADGAGPGIPADTDTGDPDGAAGDGQSLSDGDAAAAGGLPSSGGTGDPPGVDRGSTPAVDPAPATGAGGQGLARHASTATIFGVGVALGAAVVAARHRRLALLDPDRPTPA